MTILSLLALIAMASPSDTLKTDSVVLPPVRGAGPLEPGSWGMGFRVLGSTSEIRIRRALSDRICVGVDAGWSGAYDKDQIERTGTSWDIDDNTFVQKVYTTTETRENVYESFRVTIPVEWIPRCRGALCVVGSAGPFYAFSRMENQTDLPESDNVVANFSRSENTSHELGATGSLGARWEFLPGLSLASSFGADAKVSFGEATGELHRGGKYPDGSSSTTSSTGIATRSWFGGIGLDAWF